MAGPCAIRRALLVAGLVAVATALPPARGVEPGGGVATGTVSCESGRGALDLTTDMFVYRGAARRAVSVTVEDVCQQLGPAVVYAQGPARITGEGFACGTDPARPFVGRFDLMSEGRRMAAVFDGSCVIDGTEQRAAFAADGVVMDGTVTGVLRPDDQGD